METGLKAGSNLVSGATGGIGAATLRLLATEGADVIAAGRNQERLKTSGLQVMPPMLHRRVQLMH